jgi:hypothetical protein
LLTEKNKNVLQVAKNAVIIYNSSYIEENYPNALLINACGVYLSAYKKPSISLIFAYKFDRSFGN